MNPAVVTIISLHTEMDPFRIQTRASNHQCAKERNSTLFLYLQMDSFSMFEDTYPSADNHVSGIVALLAAAEAIGKVKEKIRDSPNDILFTFFQGVR